MSDTSGAAEAQLVTGALRTIAEGGDVETTDLVLQILQANLNDAHANGQALYQMATERAERAEKDARYWRDQFYAARGRMMDLFDAPRRWRA